MLSAPGGVDADEIAIRTILQNKNRPQTASGCFGAGDGNRTHATSLEGWDSTIELHPHSRKAFQMLSYFARVVNYF